jgi:hypothetical protein
MAQQCRDCLQGSIVIVHVTEQMRMPLRRVQASSLEGYVERPVACPLLPIASPFFPDSALSFFSRSCASRKFLQYSQFGSAQNGDPNCVCWCGTGWLAIF